MYAQRDTLAFIIAGGRGSRLGPLTATDAKPMLTFGGKYRLIDFVMSNLFNSEIRKGYVLTQYNTTKLNRHINKFWGDLAGRGGMYIAQSPQETLDGKAWYEGTADAISHNRTLIKEENPKNIAIFGADHIYMMDVGHMLRSHAKDNYDLTISAIEVPYEDAKSFGVFEVDNEGNFIGFEEKPKDPKRIPGKDTCLASMGNYIFKRESLCDALDETSDIRNLDFGKHIIPFMINKNKEKIHVYNFNGNKVDGLNEYSTGYWRDVGTIDAYYEASMELLDPIPRLDLSNRQWPIFSDQGITPPAKSVRGSSGRKGIVEDSYLTGGCIVSGGNVINSILGPFAYVDDHAFIENSIIFDNVKVGNNAKIEKSIISSGVIIPPGVEIGFDEALDRKRGFIPNIKDSPTNIRVITADMNLEAIINDIK